MKIFLQRDAYEWDVVENGITTPMKYGKPKPLKDLSAEEVNALNYNAKAMNALLSGMAATELRKVSASFRLERDESIIDAQGRFLTLMNSISLLDKIIPQVDINRKILRAMPKKFSSKVTILQDSPSISTMETLTLFSELEEFENQLRRYDEEDEAPRKKTLALNADAGDSSEDSDEEIALLTKKFHKFLAKRNASKQPMKSSFPKKEFRPSSSKESKNNQNKDACFECEKKCHFKKDCYKLKAKKKALLKWSDDDSEVEIDSEDELAQLCFAGLEYDSSDNDEAQNRKLKEKNAYLKQTLSEVLNEVDDSIKDESLVDENKLLSEKVSKLKEEVNYLKNEIEMKDACLDALKKETFSAESNASSDSIVPELEQKVAQLETGLAKCFHGEGTLNVLLVQQKSSLDKESLVHVPRNKWIIDSGCSRHMTGDKSKFLSLIAKEGGLVTLGDSNTQEEICLGTVQEQQNLWYRRLGHVHMDLLRKISSHELVRGLPKLMYKKTEPCSACQHGKQVKTSFTAKNKVLTYVPLQLLHLDLFGPERYTIRSDHGGEFEKDFVTFCKSRGITHEFTAPRTPQQNGVVERKNRTLQETARTLLHESNMPRKFWAEVVNTSCRVLNRVLIRPILLKTPYELLKNKTPNISYFRVFGSKCFILDTQNTRGKFDAKSTEGIFLGYSTTNKAYRVYNFIKHKVEESINIAFNESALKISQIEEDVADQPSHSQTRQSQSQKGQASQEKSDSPRYPDSSNSSGNSQDSPQTHDQWSNDSFTSPQVNSIQEEMRQSHSKSQSQSKETTHIPYQADNSNEEEMSTIQLPKLHNLYAFYAFIAEFEPKNAQEAVADECWSVVMQEELNQFERCQVWELVSPPSNVKFIGTRWVFKNKKDEDGNIVRNKARLVAQGYNKQE
ncbi:uncharacterized protein LOC141686177 [Apium graveolens]|uniref:uncharacterized protein LOC141686177 n=1 Tax=Apium graveolens TaxID=4045 RepID=UPI003D7A6A9A